MCFDIKSSYWEVDMSNTQEIMKFAEPHLSKMIMGLTVSHKRISFFKIGSTDSR